MLWVRVRILAKKGHDYICIAGKKIFAHQVENELKGDRLETERSRRLLQNYREGVMKACIKDEVKRMKKGKWWIGKAILQIKLFISSRVINWKVSGNR